MKSVQMGSWKALNETAKIAKIMMRIAKFRKAVDEICDEICEEMKMVRGRPSTKLRKLQKLRKSRKIENFAGEFNPGHKWEANPLGQDPL